MNPALNATVSKERASSGDGSHDARNTATSLPRPLTPVLTEEMLARFELAVGDTIYLKEIPGGIELNRSR